jgi:hypothetical protein
MMRHSHTAPRGRNRLFHFLNKAALGAIPAMFCAAVLLLMAASYAPAAQAQAIYAAAECIEIIPNGYRANFSFESFEKSPVFIAVGANNNMSPGAADQGQVTTFYPGYVERAFRVDVVATPPAMPADITWNFLGRSFTAGLATVRCRSLTRPAVTPVITQVSGANQATAVNSAFAQPISFLVTLNGRLLVGFNLEIRLPSSGASGVAIDNMLATNVASTDGNGIARFFVTANGVAGNYAVVVAGAAPVASVTFQLTNQ